MPPPASSTTSPSSTRSTSTAGDDRDELLRTDIAFHEAIVRASRNDLLCETYRRIAGELADWRCRSYAEPGVPLRSAREHAKVVRFLRNQDPGGARAAMNSHLHRSYDGLAEIEYEPLDSTDSGSEVSPDGGISAANYSYRPFRVVM